LGNPHLSVNGLFHGGGHLKGLLLDFFPNGDEKIQKAHLTAAHTYFNATQSKVSWQLSSSEV